MILKIIKMTMNIFLMTLKKRYISDNKTVTNL